MSLPIALGLMTSAELRYETAESIVAATAKGMVSQVFFVQNGPYLDLGRNATVRVFNDPDLRERCTHLLMVDSDIAFSPDDIAALYDAEKPVVGGVYYSLTEGAPKIVVHQWNEVDGRKMLETIYRWPDGWPTWMEKMTGQDREHGLDPLVQVDAIGAGFLMIWREVLDDMSQVYEEPQPWFSEPVIDGNYFGEDLAFCMRVQEMGFPVWAHRGVEVAHIKPAMLGPKPQR